MHYEVSKRDVDAILWPLLSVTQANLELFSTQSWVTDLQILLPLPLRCWACRRASSHLASFHLHTKPTAAPLQTSGEMNFGHACMNTGGQTQDSRRRGGGVQPSAPRSRRARVWNSLHSKRPAPCPPPMPWYSHRQPHTAVWDFFLSAGFPDVCLILTSLNCHTKKRKGHLAHLSWAVVTQRAPEPVPPRVGCSHHTTKQPLERNAPGGHHSLPGSHPSSSCVLPPPLSCPSLPFLPLSLLPTLFCWLLFFLSMSREFPGLASSQHMWTKDSDLGGRRHLPCCPQGQRKRASEATPLAAPKVLGKGWEMWTNVMVKARV